MKKKALILGATGKLGTAFVAALARTYEVVGKGSRDIDIADGAGLRAMLENIRPDIVVNAVACMGLAACEQGPQRAFQINTLGPKSLAELSNELKFILVHFSSDAVFDGSKGDFYVESDGPRPVNVYGLSKYGGDCFVQAAARRFYVFRIPVLFGETPKKTQFVEKMLEKALRGETLCVSNDIFSSPSYSRDIAAEAVRLLDSGAPWGLYHLANEGRASLFALMTEIVLNLGLQARIQGVPGDTFPSLGIRNRNTPLRSLKLRPLRPWREALREYCLLLGKAGR